MRELICLLVMVVVTVVYSVIRGCFVPRFIGDTMDMLQVSSMEDVQSLPVYKWGIKQPSGQPWTSLPWKLLRLILFNMYYAVDDTARANALDTGGLDLIIVPGLGFTKVSA